MIGFLRGVLAHKQPPYLVIDVNGVGYELEAPMSTVFLLPDVGQDIELLTHLLIRDDNHTLFGFASAAERILFRNLLKVSGVGAKLALTILSGISVQAFERCVREEDSASLVRLPGVGRKTAERLIIDMRDRLDAKAPAAIDGSISLDATASMPRTEAFNALVTLGYKPGEAQKMLDGVNVKNQSTEAILRDVLRSAAT